MYDLDSLMKVANIDLVLKITGFLHDQGLRSYVVGGWVRDNLLSKPTRDVDFAVQGDGIEAARRVALEIGGRFVLLDEVNRVGRVVLKVQDEPERIVQTLDFASMLGNDIKADLSRRDFTIDAVAIDPEKTPVDAIDPCHGLDDLENKMVRVTNPNAFVDDPVRLIRAVRLAGQLGFNIDPETRALVRRDAGLISRVSGERIHEELVLLLSGPGSGRLIAEMQTMGLLTSLLPELKTAEGAEQPREHHWDVLRHSLETAKAFDFLLREADWEFGNEKILHNVPWSMEIERYFKKAVGYGSTCEALFRLACALHDNAKPQTRTVESSGRIRFLGHAQQGSETARTIMERLRFSMREIRLVETAIKYHLRPTQMGWPELPTQRAVYRYKRDTGEAATGILFLSLADHLAMRGPDFDERDWEIHTAISAHILYSGTELPAPKQLLVDGYDIMNIFGLKPGRQVGDLLEIVRETQASGLAATREDMLALLRETIDKPASHGKDEPEIES